MNVCSTQNKIIYKVQGLEFEKTKPNLIFQKRMDYLLVSMVWMFSWLR